MSEHYWRTHWNGREYVMDDTGRLNLATDGQGSADELP